MSYQRALGSRCAKPVAPEPVELKWQNVAGFNRGAACSRQNLKFMLVCYARQALRPATLTEPHISIRLQLQFQGAIDFVLPVVQQVE